MKKVLSLLMIFVFLNVSSWAYAPVYPASSASITGTYAGVLVPSSTAANSGAASAPSTDTTGTTTTTTTTTAATAASIGLFGIGIPASTSGIPVSQGSAVLFVNGAVYNGDITGVLDPQDSSLSAIVEASSSFSRQSGTTTIVTFFYAQGSLNATLQQGSSPRGSTASGGANTPGAERITGTAVIDLYQTLSIATGAPIVTGVVSYTVSGFQQSSVYAVPVFAVSAASNTGG